MSELTPEQVLNLNPYSPLVWGFVIFMLITAIAYFYKQNERKQEYIDKLIDKTHDALDVVCQKLAEIKNHNESKDEAIITALEDIKRKLEK
jgi:hypothetical protein